MSAANRAGLPAVSPRDVFDRLVLLDPEELTGTPEREARDVIEAEGLRATPVPARVEDRIIEGSRWLAVTLRVWRPRERLMDGVERTVR